MCYSPYATFGDTWSADQDDRPTVGWGDLKLGTPGRLVGRPADRSAEVSRNWGHPVGRSSRSADQVSPKRGVP
jgi:hypothetical protein